MTRTVTVAPFSAMGVMVKIFSGSLNDLPIRSGASNQSL